MDGNFAEVSKIAGFMDFEWTVLKIFTDVPEKEYINSCCIGCDEILFQLKPDIALQMSVDKNSIEIYQEDWGWALEFTKEKVFYLLAINNACEVETKQTLFFAYTQATHKEKGMFLDKIVDADKETKLFSKIVSELAEKNGF